MRLAGECALVTGSTSGSGRQVAVMFAREGARVAVHGRDAARGAAVVQEIQATGGTAVFVAADLGDEAAATAMVHAATAALGGLTVLVNNAVLSSAAGGAGRDGPIGTLDGAYWDQALRVNLSSAAWCTRAAIPAMHAAGRGSIINISSRQAERVSPGMTAYATSKGGLNAFTRAVAIDYGRQNIRCNALSVGYVFNQRRDADLTPERRQRLEGMHVTRLGRAEDVGWACVYLASRESEFVTGVVLPVDGGSTAARGLVLG